jgi:hypothetical protein
VISVLLRIAFVALIALGLSRLARTATTEKVATVYLIDVSESVTDEALDDARRPSGATSTRRGSAAISAQDRTSRRRCSSPTGCTRPAISSAPC